MALPLVTVAGKIAASPTNNVIGQVNEQGSTLTKPTTIASGGGSASISSLGVVSFTGVTSISLNNCFSASSDIDEVIIDVPTTSANTSLNFVFRLAGADVTSANYDAQNTFASAAAATVSQNLAAAFWGLPGATTAFHFVRMTLAGAGLARPTTGESRAVATLNPMTAAATTGTNHKGLLHRLSTAYDGLTISASAGTITGTIRVIKVNQGS